MSDLLKTKGQPLAPELAAEWDDKRDAAWVRKIATASWKCPQGHRYQMSRAQREAAHAKGVDPCPNSRHKRQPKVAVHAAPATQDKPAVKATAQQDPAAVSSGPAKAPGSPNKAIAATAAGSPSPAPSKGRRKAQSTQGAAPGPQVQIGAGGAGEAGAAQGAQAQQTAQTTPAKVAPQPASGVFVARDLFGRPSALYEWFRATPGAHRSSVGPAHHVFVIDRSGSMFGDIGGVRDLVRRLLAVEEYRRPGLIVSVVSYSSRGSLRRHVERQPVSELGDRTSLDALQADGLTCMSDGLRAALELLRTGERSTVTVHSDGYVNDPDPATERRDVEGLCGRLRVIGATVNTVAHRKYSDFALLAQIANDGGGACVQAGDLHTVYDALVAAHRAAGGPVGVNMTAPPGAQYAVRVSQSSRRVLCQPFADGQATIEGVAVDEVVYFVGLKRALDPFSHEEKPDSPGSEPVMLAMARGMIGMGRHALGKAIALSTGYDSLRKHARALTGAQVAALASEIEGLLLEPSGSSGAAPWTSASRSPVVPQPEPRTTLPELLAVLGRLPGAVKVFLPALIGGYVRRGLKRVPGKWEGGVIVEPSVCAVKRRSGTGADGWVDLVSVDQNDAEATVNLTLSEPIELAVRGGGRFSEIAGVSLEGLRQYKSFTVISDGEVCLKSLPCRITSGDTHAELARLGAVKGPFDPDKRVDVDLDLPVTRHATVPVCPPLGDVARLLRLTALHKLLQASLRDGSGTRYSPEQVAALKAVHVTPSLNFSPPTCYPYEDLKVAQAQGKVDSRTRYRVVFGALGLQPGDLPSANEFIARRYVVEGAVEPDKPTAIDFFSSNSQVREKTAAEARRLKLGPADALCGPIYALAAARSSGKPWPRHAIAVDSCGIDTSASITTGNLASESPSRGVGSAELGLPAEFGTGGSWASPVARLVDLARVETALEALLACMREVVMAVGACGQVPDGWGPPVDVADVEKAGFKLSKGDRNGSFRLCGGVLAGVVPVEALYSVSYESSFDAT